MVTVVFLYKAGKYYSLGPHKISDGVMPTHSDIFKSMLSISVSIYLYLFINGQVWDLAQPSYLCHHICTQDNPGSLVFSPILQIKKGRKEKKTLKSKAQFSRN